MKQHDQYRDYSNARILIVDDTPANVILLQKILQMSGYKNIRTLTDSREVIQTYLAYKPDLLLLDLRMPYMDGLEVLEKLGEIKGDDYIPVIIITAQDDKETRLRGYQLGAKDYISKPIDNMEVLMRIRNMLEIRLSHDELKDYNKQLEEKVAERTREVSELQLELINRLLLAVEFRDDATGKHILRIGNYARELGRLIGMGDAECTKLFHASMMHDIGKIGIPDEILLKPGKLTEAEFERMKTHTVKGAEILVGSASEIINIAEVIALTHHERWDGQGYPAGLKGEQIPLVGRITSLIDVFDVLLAKRPYKEAWEFGRVLQYIESEIGRQFDPYLARVFLNNIRQFTTIKEEFSE
jgi:putative two-component system response regulator